MKKLTVAAIALAAMAVFAQDKPDAKEISVADYFGLQKFNVADLKGRVVVLEFWASW